MKYLQELEPVVSFALQEDIGSGDITAALIPESYQARAQVLCREPAVLCGQAWFDEVFRQLDREIQICWLKCDGDRINEDTVIVELEGHARSILTGERTALNFLQTLSGTASIAAKYAAKLPPGLRLKDTRKTLPCLRRAQKYAVKTGGCDNHRLGLFDAFLIKDNHIAACGSIALAVDQARKLSPGIPVEVETENLTEVEEALKAAADTIMLDNFTDSDIRQAVALINGRAEIEVSGNVNLDDMDAGLFAGVDYISLGALTKHCQAIDFSMRIFDMDDSRKPAPN